MELLSKSSLYGNWATLLGLLTGLAINLMLPWFLYYGAPPDQRISFAWVGLPGWIATLVVVVLVSLLDRNKSQNLDGFTWDSVKKPV